MNLNIVMGGVKWQQRFLFFFLFLYVSSGSFHVELNHLECFVQVKQSFEGTWAVEWGGNKLQPSNMMHFYNPLCWAKMFPMIYPIEKMYNIEGFGDVMGDEGHFTYETESPWPLHIKHSHWWKRRSRSKFVSHYAWGTNQVCKCKMDVKFTWIPTWHQVDHISWPLGLFWKNHFLEVGPTHNLETMAL